MSGIWDWLLRPVNKNMAYILSAVFWLSFVVDFSGRQSQGSSSAAHVQWSLEQLKACVIVCDNVSQQMGGGQNSLPDEEVLMGGVYINIV